MATIVTQYDPWREKLAAGLGVNLLSDAIQRSQAADAQRKNNAVYAETLKSLGLMGDEQGESLYDPLLPSQTVPEGYNNNGWAKTMHDSYDPISQFNFNLGALETTQTTPQNRNLGQLDYITALAKTINSDPKRFGGIDFSNIYSNMLKPTMEADAADYASKLAEQQRARQLDLASALSNAKTPQERALLLEHGIAGGIFGDKVSGNLVDLYKHNNPHVENVITNLGGQTLFGSYDPLTGKYSYQDLLTNSLSPDKRAEVGLGYDKLAWEQTKGAGELGIKQMEFTQAQLKQSFEQLGVMEKSLNEEIERLLEIENNYDDPDKRKDAQVKRLEAQQQLASIQQQKAYLYQAGLMGMSNFSGQSQQGGGQEYTQVNSRVRGYSDLINKYAQEFGVDPDLMTAIMQAESSGNPNAVSGKGARGLMQFMPDTAANIARNLGIKEYDLHDPETSIKFGAALLKELQTRYKGNLEGILGDYNGGPKGANPKTRRPETQNYIPKVLSILNALKAERQAAQQQQAQTPQEQGQQATTSSYDKYDNELPVLVNDKGEILTERDIVVAGDGDKDKGIKLSVQNGFRGYKEKTGEGYGLFTNPLYEFGAPKPTPTNITKKYIQAAEYFQNMPEKVINGFMHGIDAIGDSPIYQSIANLGNDNPTASRVSGSYNTGLSGEEAPPITIEQLIELQSDPLISSTWFNPTPYDPLYMGNNSDDSREFLEALSLPYWINGENAINGFYSRFRGR